MLQIKTEQRTTLLASELNVHQTFEFQLKFLKKNTNSECIWGKYYGRAEKVISRFHFSQPIQSFKDAQKKAMHQLPIKYGCVKLSVSLALTGIVAPDRKHTKNYE